MNVSDISLRHSRVNSYALAMMRQVADQSGLARDPELASAYLANNLVTEVGHGVDVMGQVVGQAAVVAARGKLLPEDSAQMSYLHRELLSANQQVRDNMKATAGSGRQLDASTETLASAAEQSAADLGRKAKYDFEQTLAGVSTAEYVALGGKATRSYFELWDKCSDMMDAQLTKRVEDLNTQKWTNLTGALLVLLITIGIAFWIQRGITSQVRSVMRLFSSIGAGDLKARADVVAHDELGMITEGLNGMLDNTLNLMQSKDEKEQIQRSIARLLDEVSGVAEGDLRKEAEVTADITGAIADSFNYMIAELRSLIASVQRTTAAVNESASGVRSTAEVLARGSEAQSERLVEASTVLGQMAGSITQVSATASSAASVASEALNSAQLGAESVRQTMAGMNAIRTQVQETAKRVKRLGESSQEIGEVADLIADIADRTSILALNASIQAAMAGEAGKGFAVVADEVERLAERSTGATKRIGALIKSVQGDMNEAIAAMEATTREVVGGSQLANEAGRRLSEIETVSRKISGLVEEISQAARQQAAGSESVARDVTGIAQVTRETAAGVRQAAAATEQLAELAERLNSSVRRFQVPESELLRRGAVA
jgi:methyl-accepting chemotaxis protein